MTIHATCDNIIEVYADGTLVASGNNWSVTYSATLDSTPAVVAVACKDTGVVGGILLSADNGLRSDSSWRCSNEAEEGWNQVNI